MNDHFLQFITLVSEMRIAQKQYFRSRKMHDYTSSSKWLEQAVKLEKEVDNRCKQLNNELKNGEQSSLF